MPMGEPPSTKCTHDIHDIAHVVEFSPFEWSSQLLAIGTASRVTVVTFNKKERGGNIELENLRDFHHGARVTSIAWSPQSSLTDLPRVLKFCTGGSDKKLRLFASDLKNNDNVKVLEGHVDYINSACYHPDTGAQVASVSDDYTCRIWSTEDGHQVSCFPLGGPGMTVCWHPHDPQQLMVAEKGGIIRVYSLTSNQPIMSFSSSDTPLMSCDWSLSNPMRIVAMVPGSYVLFDRARSSQPISKKQVHSEGGRTAKIARCTDHLVATLGPRSQVKVTNIRTDQTLLDETFQVLNGLSWHHNLPVLAVGGDRQIHIWTIT